MKWHKVISGTYNLGIAQPHGPRLYGPSVPLLEAFLGPLGGAADWDEGIMKVTAAKTHPIDSVYFYYLLLIISMTSSFIYSR